MGTRIAIVTHVLELAGLACARALHRDGLTVVCHDARFTDAATRKAFETEESGLLASVEQDPSALVAAVIRDHGQVDVLYSNDVFPAAFVPVEEITLEQFRATLEGLTVMPFALCRALAPHMKERRAGNIILFSSATPLSPYPFSSAYCAARAAASNLAVSLSREFAPHNIQINAIQSQFLHSEIYYPRDLFENNAEVKAYLHNHVPAKRLGEQTELAELVAFLASGKCNFVNGQNIPFTGAWPGMPKWPATFK
jgi:NAD(P)-dependent dehydrogenase (short-subunit alcohol dehydrogenase family)